MKQDQIKLQYSNIDGSTKNNLLSLDLKSLKNTGASFRNRFQAQKTIINKQKIKLHEQERIINELKMGILTEEVRNSLDKSKSDIRELFGDCKLKLIGRVPLEYVPLNDSEKISVHSQSAPKILQLLEQRAYERMKYREMIKERKRILEETKKKLYEEALEQKKCLEEEEKKKHLEMIRERRKEDLERMAIRQANKEKFIKDSTTATEMYKRKLLAHSFSRWKFQFKWSRDKAVLCEEHYKKNILKKSFKALLGIVQIKYSIKYNVADKFYKRSMLKKAIIGFRQNRLERMRSMQIAEDYYDFRLQCKVVDHWTSYIHRAVIIESIKMQQAIYQHQRKLLFQSFFQWKSLPTVLKLEKAKEERKQKWRQKVWEILPDFKPSEI
ncbi:hypothetical protein HHI36_008007 [Cryptolaemus montrouzieri]|uniref:Uncharacterized protein n=1 Tax=Cryptolaemus montrouzieri TaxID=559131 RepID=A0ABD2MRB1_9CUCU